MCLLLKIGVVLCYNKIRRTVLGRLTETLCTLNLLSNPQCLVGGGLVLIIKTKITALKFQGDSYFSNKNRTGHHALE